MSYLMLPKGIRGFRQAVMSLWFRAPTESVLKVVNRKPESGAGPALSYILPLIVFGKPQMQQDFTYLYGDVLTNPRPVEEGRHDHYEAYYDWETTGDPYDVGPCYIGLQCFSDGTFDLAFNLQMDTYGTYSALDWVAVSATADWSAGTYVVVLKDTSPTIKYNPPEYFFVQTPQRLTPAELATGFGGWKPDQWHHLLLSFDLVGDLKLNGAETPAVSSTCRLWYAIDDTDYRGAKNLGPNRDADDGLGDNTILTQNMYDNSGTGFDGQKHGMPVAPPTGTYIPALIPSSDQQFGIPASGGYVKDILRVEMAEFQMWTGIALDTGVEDNRRAFIDYERDERGNPIKDKDGNYTLLPVAPEKAETLLTKKPDIMLHGSSDWIMGANTGTAEQFKPVAKINPYKPDPSLNKSPAPAPSRSSVRLTQRA
jgi:hypothetical protein